MAAERPFRECRRLGVVGDIDRQPGAAPEPGRQAQVTPVEVDRPAHRAGTRVHEAGRADADTQWRLRGKHEQSVEQLLEAVEGIVTVATLQGELLAMADLAREVDDGPADLALPHVDADELAGIPRDLQQDGGLATTGRTSADLLDQARRRELVDDVRDRRAGQVRPARDVRPADRPQTGQGAHDEPHIVLARVLVGRLGQRSHPATFLLRTRHRRPHVAPPLWQLSGQRAYGVGADVVKSACEVVATTSWGSPAPPVVVPSASLAVGPPTRRR